MTRVSRSACTRPPRRSTLRSQRRLSAPSPYLSPLDTLDPIRKQSSRGPEEGGREAAFRPGDDAREREPQGDHEIERTSLDSLEDAEGEMGHPRALDHPRALQVDRPGAEVVEQADAAPEQDGHQIDVDLVQGSRSDALLHDARGAYAD